MSLDVSELEPTTRNDFRRANGAPQIVDKAGKGQRYSRPSSFAKPLDDESALTNWRIDRAAIGVGYDRALQAAYVAVDQDDREELKRLREKAIAAGRGAERADIGTALHAMSVRWEQDPKYNPPEPYSISLAAYERVMKELGLETVRYEYHVVNDQYRCAGTADRLYELTRPLTAPDGTVLPVGTLITGDLKTGDKLEYSKAAYSVQLCLYAEGEFYDVLKDEYVATPPINQDWAIIVHMPADDPGVCEFLWCDLEVGRWGCYLVDQIKRWRKSWRSGEFALPLVTLDRGVSPDDHPTAEWRTNIEGDTTPEEQTPDEAVAEADDQLASWIEWIVERVKAIGEHDTARTYLTIEWPQGCPTPRKIENMYQVGIVLNVLSKVEAEFGLSFVPRPAAILPPGHQSTLKGK